LRGESTLESIHTDERGSASEGRRYPHWGNFHYGELSKEVYIGHYESGRIVSGKPLGFHDFLRGVRRRVTYSL